jgi:hypothetical protein
MPTNTISRLDAVRAALDAGKQRAADGVAFIKSTFGLEISPATFENYRATARAGAPKKRGRPPAQASAPAAPALQEAAAPKKRGRRRRRGRKAGPSRAAAAALPPTLVRTLQRGRLDVDDVRQVLELCDRHGAETVKALVALLV